MNRVTNLSSQKFGRWTVLKLAFVENRKYYWLCKCQCGTTRDVRSDHLKTGNSLSCGCYQKEIAAKTSTIHGHQKNGKKSSEYMTWDAMKARCCNPNSKQYHDYGGRGIRICKKWETSFESFLEDMGEKPGDNYDIDRIDNNGDYDPGNCRWATRQQNCFNRGIYRNNTSGYKGVYRDKKSDKWVAEIMFNGKGIYLGRFEAKVEAAKAYNEAAKKYFGEYAYLNDV